MGGSGSFASIFRFSLFCLGVWICGDIVKRWGLNDQVPNILSGVAMGPYGLKVLPETYAVCMARQHMQDDNLQFIADINSKYGAKCADADYLAKEEYADEATCIKKKKAKERIDSCLEYPDVFTVIGHFGVSLLIFRAGLHFDPYGGMGILKESLLHGFLGTLFPILIGFAFVKFWFDKDGTEPTLSAYAVGVSLAPTSIGMAIGLLLNSDMAATEFGQGIIMGSLIDDIFALGAFEVLVQANYDDNKVKTATIAKSSLGFAFVGMGIIISLAGWKPLMEKPANKLAEKYPPGESVDDFGNKIRSRFPMEHQWLMFMMCVTLIGMSYFTSVYGSHLWGCFATGIMFAPVGKALKIWRYQTKKLQAWFLRFFFAGSVGFSLNVDALLDTEAVWKGLILGVFGAIGGKHLAGFWLKDSFYVVGWAMTCRAEFAYLVAQMCYWKGMMSEHMFSITLWSLFLATLAGPLGYDFALKKMIAKGSPELEKEASAGARLQPGSATDKEMQSVAPDIVGELEQMNAEGRGASGASVFTDRRGSPKVAANMAKETSVDAGDKIGTA